MSSAGSTTTSTLGLTLTRYLRPTLPVITTLLNLLGLGGGLLSITHPPAGARGFGIVLPGIPSAIETAYARVHGVRNIGNALTGLALLIYLRFFTGDGAADVPVKATLRKVIGLSLLCGTTVAFGDGLVLKDLAESTKDGDVRGWAAQKAPGHMVIAVPIALWGVGWLVL